MRPGAFAFTVSMALLTLLGQAIGSKYIGGPQAFALQRRSRLTPHDSEAGKYRASFPREPKSDTKDLSLGTSGHTVQLTTDRADGPNGTVFAVTYADYPEVFRKVTDKTILDGVRDGLKGTDGNILKDNEVFLGEGADKIAGREFQIVAGRKIVHVRAFMQGNRLYQIMVTGTKDRFPSDLVKEFHNSFKLLK